MNPVRPTSWPRRRTLAGFSLVEINIALFVLGVGLVSLLGLFPVGLRQGNLSYSDTIQTMFADQVLNMIQANAAEIDAWNDFNNSRLLKDVKIGNHVIEAGKTNMISQYLGMADHSITYYLRIENVTKPINFDGYLKRVSIRSSDRDINQVDIAQNPIFSCDIVYMGKVQ